MKNNPKLKGAFYAHRDRARRRGIPFKFTFQVWCNWWESNLGPDWFSLRGNGRYKFCMARNLDKGCYEPSNVECITCSQNVRDSFINNVKRVRSVNNTYHKLDVKKVHSILTMGGTQEAAAVKFGVSARMVRMIRNRQVWKHVKVKGESR